MTKSPGAAGTSPTSARRHLQIVKIGEPLLRYPIRHRASMGKDWPFCETKKAEGDLVISSISPLRNQQ